MLFYLEIINIKMCDHCFYVIAFSYECFGHVAN